MISSPLSFLEFIRETEIRECLDLFPKSGRVLEIGAGSGWQALYLSKCGYEVEAIDIASSQYLEQSVFPVKIYDGVSIPFPSESFEVIFSSNVLEHIAELDRFQCEIMRVLKQGGSAIHVVPTAAWRVYTSLAHYPALPKVVYRYLRGDTIPTLADHGKKSGSLLAYLSLVRRALHSGRHGEHGTELSELYYFSRFRWRRLFERAGFCNIGRRSLSLSYTGYSILGSRLPVELRRWISRFIGSSCHVFFMVKN